MVLDRTIGMPVLMACAEGGVEIEEVAARTPEKILKAAVDPDAGLQPFQARRWPSTWDSRRSRSPKAEAIMTRLARVFLDKDCSLAEINPLVVTPAGDVVVLDAKISFRRQRPVPPSRHREAARRRPRRTPPSCGRPSRA